MLPAQIATPTQARILLLPELLPVIHALMQAPLSVGEVAARLGLPPRRAYSLVTRLQKAGIAQVTAHRARQGRAVKVYRIPGPWRIPFHVTGADTLEHFLWTQMGPRFERFHTLLARQFLAHQPDWGYWVMPHRMGLGGEDGIADHWINSDEPLHLMVGGLHLREEDARTFKARLLALQREYEALSGEHPGGQAFALGIVLTRGQWWGDEKA